MASDGNILNDPAVRYRTATDGITKADFLSIMDMTGFNLTEFSALLPVSKRTIEKVKDQELLSPVVSDRVLQIASLYQFGSAILGDTDSFKEWIRTPLLALGHKRPLDYMQNDTGLSIIRDILGRIEQGVYS